MTGEFSPRAAADRRRTLSSRGERGDSEPGPKRTQGSALSNPVGNIQRVARLASDSQQWRLWPGEEERTQEPRGSGWREWLVCGWAGCELRRGILSKWGGTVANNNNGPRNGHDKDVGVWIVSDIASFSWPVPCRDCSALRPGRRREAELKGTTPRQRDTPATPKTAVKACQPRSQVLTRSIVQTEPSPGLDATAMSCSTSTAFSRGREQEPSHGRLRRQGDRCRRGHARGPGWLAAFVSLQVRMHGIPASTRVNGLLVGVAVGSGRKCWQ